MNMNMNDRAGATLSLPSDREISIVRDFKAPRDLVFDAWSKAEHVRHWYGMCHFTLTTCDLDFRVGGKWRFVMHDPERGADHPLSGEFTEIRRPDRMVFTERYEPVPGSEHVVTLTFEETNGVTRFEQRMFYPSVEARDGHLRSGFEPATQESLRRLEEFLSA
jgi:uncharacterized protein YndB with AHSA1/START domain